MKRTEQTPEQREMFAELRRARDRAKSKRRRAERRAAKLEASPVPAVSKTHPIVRRRLYGPAPEMTKSQMRAMLTEAVRNTAGAGNAS